VRIPITFTYEGKEIKGKFTFHIKGIWFLHSDSYLLGILNYKNGNWHFESASESSYVELTEIFARVVIAAYDV
jgi:hypothetical protein